MHTPLLHSSGSLPSVAGRPFPNATPPPTQQAAGLIPLAHNSGGPRADIVAEEETGFLAATPEEYAQALGRLFPSTDANATDDDDAARERAKAQTAMRARARAAAGRFSDEVFLGAFGGLMREFLGLGGKEEGGSGLRRSGLRRSSRGKKSS